MSRRGHNALAYTPADEGRVRLRPGRPPTPLAFEPGEREAMIAEALAQGRVTECPPGFAMNPHFFKPGFGLIDKARKGGAH